MQQARIAVDENLSPVRALLEQAGYEVVPISHLNSADCVVVTGGSDNMTGDQTTSTKATIIATPGMTAKEVLALVEKRLR